MDNIQELNAAKIPLTNQQLISCPGKFFSNAPSPCVRIVATGKGKYGIFTSTSSRTNIRSCITLSYFYLIPFIVALTIIWGFHAPLVGPALQVCILPMQVYACRTMMPNLMSYTTEYIPLPNIYKDIRLPHNHPTSPQYYNIVAYNAHINISMEAHKAISGQDGHPVSIVPHIFNHSTDYSVNLATMIVHAINATKYFDCHDEAEQLIQDIQAFCETSSYADTMNLSRTIISTYHSIMTDVSLSVLTDIQREKDSQ